jgi:hypothetical protein
MNPDALNTTAMFLMKDQKNFKIRQSILLETLCATC